MAVKVRLTKAGAKNDAYYHLVAIDSRSPRDGRYIELLGWYDPKKKGDNFQLKMDRIEYWASKGAQLSETVRSMVRKAKRAAHA